jgi:hypothetical protein
MFKKTRTYTLMTIGAQDPIILNLFATPFEKQLVTKLFNKLELDRPNMWSNMYTMKVTRRFGIFASARGYLHQK